MVPEICNFWTAFVLHVTDFVSNVTIKVCWLKIKAFDSHYNVDRCCCFCQATCSIYYMFLSSCYIFRSPENLSFLILSFLLYLPFPLPILCALYWHKLQMWSKSLNSLNVEFLGCTETCECLLVVVMFPLSSVYIKLLLVLRLWMSTCNCIVMNL